jgi:hypothetical protein
VEDDVPLVFICYAKQDKDQASWLFESLRKAGARPWLDKENLVLGDDWELEIKRAVMSSDAFVVCLRPGFEEIGFRQNEIRWALDALRRRPPGQGFIIPYIVEPCPLPRWCEPFHAGPHLSEPTELEDVLRAIEKHTGWKRRMADATVEGPLVLKTDILVSIGAWEPLEESWPAPNRWPDEWRKHEEKSKQVKRAIENRLLELGYLPQHGAISSRDQTLVEYRDIPSAYFVELKREIDALLRCHVAAARWIKNNHMGWNLMVFLGKDVGAANNHA